jgi:hydrogenase nickel incorporation protein HypA/HybF
VHETSIAFSILETAERLAGDGRLESVSIAIGELSAVEPELLRFAWQAVVAGSAHESSELRVDWRPALQFCPQCEEQKDREPGSWLVHCPDCGKALHIQGGYELEIVEISYTEA